MTDTKLITEPDSEDESAVITYDEEGNAYTLKNEDSGQITIIEQVQGPFLSESIT